MRNRGKGFTRVVNTMDRLRPYVGKDKTLTVEIKLIHKKEGIKVIS